MSAAPFLLISYVLLQGENYFKLGVPLYEASIKADWEAAKGILDKNSELVRCSITENGDTPLHIAVSATRSYIGTEMFVENLVRLMEEADLELENKNHYTALHLAAAAGNKKAAEVMVKKNRALLTMAGSEGTIMPLYIAARFGHYEVVKYLHENSKELRDDGWTPQNRILLLLKCIENDMFDVAIQILKQHPEIGSSWRVLEVLARKPGAFYKRKYNINARTIRFVRGLLEVEDLQKENEALQLLKIIWEDIEKKPKSIIDDIMRGQPDDDKPVSRDVDEALQLQRHISERLVNMHSEIQNIIRTPPSYRKEDQALQLQKLISQHIAQMHIESQNVIRWSAAATSNHPNITSLGNATKTYSSQVMFIAAENGNVNFLVELIHRYPDLMWKLNDKNQSIFHIAVMHRHEGIYNLLYEIGSMTDLVTLLIDEDGNNMLHLVGKIPRGDQIENVAGTVFQMQRELLWFKEIERMIPPSYRKRKNKDGLTPLEIFNNEHKELFTQGKKWVKETANQLMVVAALIATIVFVAAFTVPGGFSQNTGIPVLYRNRAYTIFVMADAISLFSSTASIFMFISILTSRFALRDLLESVPMKLVLFLATLFLSITTMMIAFSVSFLALYRIYLKWMLLLISFALMVVLQFVMLQYPLLADIIRSTYASSYLFKPKKHILYYENPKF